MPIYDYSCGDCGQEFEVITLRPGVDAVTCRDCHSKNVKKEQSIFGFKFKEGYPNWVNKMDDYQKRQKDKGVAPTLPQPSEVM